MYCSLSVNVSDLEMNLILKYYRRKRKDVCSNFVKLCQKCKK